MSDWREWVEAIALSVDGPTTGCEFALVDAHNDFVALLRVARAGNAMIEDVVPVPYKGYEVGRETFEKFVEALKEVEHLLD